MATAKKVQAQDNNDEQVIDLSSYDADDLLKIKQVIADELELRKQENRSRPILGMKVKVVTGKSRVGQRGMIVMHMSDDTCLVQFAPGGMQRFNYEQLELETVP